MKIYLIIMNINEVSNYTAVPEFTAKQLYFKKYYVANKERLNARRIQYRDAHLEKNRLFHREFHLKHKESRNEYTRNYYRENKDAINEYQAEKFKCPCGGRYTRSNILQHERSHLHIRSLERNKIIN